MFQGRKYLRIGIEQNPRGLGDAEAILKNLRLDHAFEIVSIGIKIRFGKCNSARLYIFLEIGQHRIRYLEQWSDRWVGCQKTALAIHKTKECKFGIHQFLEVRFLRNLDGEIRGDSTAAVK